MGSKPEDYSTSKSSNRSASMQVRSMRLEDLEQVYSIDRRSFNLPWPASAFRYELLENPNSMLWVAEIQEIEPKVVGMIVVWLILDEAHIATIAVDPDYRSRGVAKRLIRVSLWESIQKGARLATLEVRANNAVAQALYQRFDFEVVGRRPRYYRDNHEDALLMTVDFRKWEKQGKSYLAWLENGGPENRDVA